MKNFRPLSDSLIQKLKQCHKAEMDTKNEKPFMMEDMRYAVAPLFKRGLIEVKKEVVNNKILHCIHLTKKGIEFLETINFRKNILKI